MADEATAEIQGETGGEVAAGDGGGEETTDAALLSAIGLLSPEDGAEAEKPTEETEAEKPADEKPKKKNRREFETFLMSETELAKPDGLKKAADYWQKRQRALDGIDVRLSARGAEQDERDATFKAAYERANSELEGDRSYARKLATIRERLVNPKDIADRLDAIGEIIERPGQGREVWDSWAKWAIAGGKRPEVNATVQALEQKIEKLTAIIERMPEEQRGASERAEEARLEAAIASRAPAVIALASDATKYPAIADKMALKTWQDGLLNDVVRLRTEARARGTALDLPGALSIINDALLKKQGSPAGAKPAAPASATPASPVAAKATSIAPSQARSMPVVREKTQEERDRDLANDTDFLATLFG
jgi:hypothetical protein